MTLLRRLASRGLDLLFPPECAVCGREGSFLCADCEPRLQRLVQPYCAKCAEPDAEPVCSWCRAKAPAYERIRAPYRYTGPVRDMVHDLKYANIRALAPTLGGLLADYLESQRFSADVLAPVPLHPRRERSRGYNQSHLLAREVSRRIQIPMADDRLLRSMDTPPQVAMSGREERRQNIDGAFECTGEATGLGVLLIDDVVTTGSTMSACASALKDAGAKSVYGLALAR